MGAFDGPYYTYICTQKVAQLILVRFSMGRGTILSC